MKQERLDALADGIFAIVMTLIVFDIRIPVFIGHVSNDTLIKSLIDTYPLFLSYILSFSLLFTYWRSHHFIASVLAKNIDIRLSNFTALFFLFVGLVPFSSRLLGAYSYTQTAVIFFALNIVLVGISLYIMRQYVIKSGDIKTICFTRTENEHANMRILLPAGAALIAILISFYSTNIAMILFTIAILFNLSRRSTRYIFYFIDLFRGKQN